MITVTETPTGNKFLREFIIDGAHHLSVDEISELESLPSRRDDEPPGVVLRKRQFTASSDGLVKVLCFYHAVTDEPDEPDEPDDE